MTEQPDVKVWMVRHVENQYHPAYIVATTKDEMIEKLMNHEVLEVHEALMAGIELVECRLF